MDKKLRVAILFGGRSAEHEVSLVSASNIVQAMSPQKYEVILIGITHEGRWIYHDQALQMLQEGSPPSKSFAFPLADPTMPRILFGNTKNEHGLPVSKGWLQVDVIFPVLHGTYGEDGTIQGLFELMDIPYVGAGVLASSVGMDKVLQKQLFRAFGLPVVNFLSFTRAYNPLDNDHQLRTIEKELDYPIFVKPANLGSSVGITKAHDRTELATAIEKAFRYDRKIILEQGIEAAREIEVSILGNEHPRASTPGEIIPTREFYDYQAKYEENSSRLEIPAPISKNLQRKLQQIAIQAFQAIDCSGMARVDFLLQDQVIYLSEVNTIPGFTKISMYPKLWEVSGFSYEELVDELIRLALERYEQKKHIRTQASNISEWFKLK